MKEEVRSFILKVNVNSKDYQKYVWLNKRSNKKLAFFRLCSAILFVLCSLSFLSGDQWYTSLEGMLRDNKIVLVIGIVILLLPWVIYPIVVKVFAMLQYRKRLWLHNSITYIYGDFGFFAKIKNEDFNVEWSRVAKVIESNSIFVLYLTNYQSFIVPKRCFNRKGDIKGFRDIVRRNVTEKNIKS